jgi:hypothetical protein
MWWVELVATLLLVVIVVAFGRAYVSRPRIKGQSPRKAWLLLVPLIPLVMAVALTIEALSAGQPMASMFAVGAWALFIWSSFRIYNWSSFRIYNLLSGSAE